VIILNIGLSCFKDIEIISIISRQDIGLCDITGKQEPVYNTKSIDNDFVIENYIMEILDIYTPASELPDDFPVSDVDEIEEILYRNWSIFKVGPTEIRKIINEFSKGEFDNYKSLLVEKVGMIRLCDIEYLERNSLVKSSSWKSFVSSIKNINRFHSKHINLEILETLFQNDRFKLKISRRQKNLFRGRISGEEKYSKEDMGPPPIKFATSGRANSEGIRCLYLANDITTVLHEIRARDLDYISIAEFEAKKDLNLVDLSALDTISPFSDETYDYEWYAINMKLLKLMSKEISKPLRRQDSTIDYLPAQYIVDFIKSLGFDGVCYKSTLNKDGLNYPFFNHKNFKCIKVDLYHIDSLTYEKNIIV